MYDYKYYLITTHVFVHNELISLNDFIIGCIGLYEINYRSGIQAHLKKTSVNMDQMFKKSFLITKILGKYEKYETKEHVFCELLKIMKTKYLIYVKAIR